MNNIENDPRCRSEEHMIPTTLFGIRRQPDFYACRKCNGQKSKIDHVLTLISKGQSSDVQLAASAWIKEFDSPKRSARLTQSLGSASLQLDGVHLAMPLTGQEIHDYSVFLAKGQYLRRSKQVFDPAERVIHVRVFLSKALTGALESEYRVTHGASPFEDIRANPLCETLGSGECLIWSKNYEYLFLFHHYTSIAIHVPLRTKKSARRAAVLRADLIQELASGKCLLASSLASFLTKP